MNFFKKPVSNSLDKSPWDDRTLVSLLKQNHEGAYRVLVRQYQRKVFRVAFGITMDHEESLDIVQEVFLKVHQNIQTFEEKAALSTWIHRITVNQCLNWKRRWKCRFRWQHQPLKESDLPELGTDGEKPDILYEKEELRHLLQEGLKRLPKDARTVFVLKELEGLSYEDIARTLNIKRGTVSSRLFYARKKLEEILKGHIHEA